LTAKSPSSRTRSTAPPPQYERVPTHIDTPIPVPPWTISRSGRKRLEILGPADRIGVPHLRCPPEKFVAAGCGGARKNVSPTGAGSAVARSSSPSAADFAQPAGRICGDGQQQVSPSYRDHAEP
jgi:hypothetical protein